MPFDAPAPAIQAGRQRSPKPSFLAFANRYGKGDEELPPLVAVAKKRAAARFTVLSADEVLPALHFEQLPGMTGDDAAIARRVTLRAEGPVVRVPRYDDRPTDEDFHVKEGEILPSWGRSTLQLEVIAKPLEGTDGWGTPLLQLFMLLATPVEPQGCEQWAKLPSGQPAWLTVDGPGGRGPLVPHIKPARMWHPSGWEAFDVVDLQQQEDDQPARTPAAAPPAAPAPAAPASGSNDVVDLTGDAE